MAEKRIGKHVYKFDEICGWDAFDLADLAVEILVPFADIIESMVKNDKVSAPEGEAAFVRAFSLAIRNRNTPAIRQIMERLLTDCRVDGEPVVVGVKPATLDEIIAVSAFAAEVQFSRFFAAGALSKVLQQVGKAS